MVHLHTFADLMAQQSHAAAECRVYDQLLRLEVVLLHGHDRQRGGPRQRDALHLLLRRDFSRKQRRDALTDQSLAHPRLPLRRGLNRAFLVVEIVRPFRGEEHLRAVVALLLSLSLLLGKVRKKEREEQRSGKSSFSLLFFCPSALGRVTVAKRNKKQKSIEKQRERAPAASSLFKNRSRRTSRVNERARSLFVCALSFFFFFVVVGARPPPPRFGGI